MKRNWLCLMAMVLLLTGCWDQRELGTISLVTGMAIDKGENARYKLTVEIVNTPELNGKTATGSSPTVVYSIEGDSIEELRQKLNISGSRTMLLSHMRVFVVSRDIASSGMMEFLDSFERSRELREDFDIILAKEGEAADILKVLYTIQKASSLKLMSQLETATKIWGSTPSVQINDFIRALTSPGRQPVMSVVRIEGEPKKGESVENMQKVHPDAIVVIDSMALFRKDKLEGFLSVEDTRNYLWTQNKLKRTTLTVPCDKDHYVSPGINDSKTKLKGTIVNGKPKIQIEIIMEGYLIGTTCEGPTDKPGTYKNIENLTNQFVKEHVLKTIKTVQKDYGIDIFGFGEVVARQDYKNFKKVQDHWDEAFQEAEIDVSVDYKLLRAGTRSKGVLNRIK